MEIILLLAAVVAVFVASVVAARRAGADRRAEEAATEQRRDAHYAPPGFGPRRPPQYADPDVDDLVADDSPARIADQVTALIGEAELGGAVGLTTVELWDRMDPDDRPDNSTQLGRLLSQIRGVYSRYDGPMRVWSLIPPAATRPPTRSRRLEDDDLTTTHAAAPVPVDDWRPAVSDSRVADPLPYDSASTTSDSGGDATSDC